MSPLLLSHRPAKNINSKHNYLYLYLALAGSIRFQQSLRKPAVRYPWTVENGSTKFCFRCLLQTLICDLGTGLIKQGDEVATFILNGIVASLNIICEPNGA